MSSKTIAYSFLTGISDFTLCIFVSANLPYASQEWARYMVELRGAPKLSLKTMVLTEGASPNAAQRKEMVDLFQGMAPPTGIVSSNSLVRGLTTALSWFNPNVKSFSPDQMGEAFAYLGVPRSLEERVWKEIWRLRAELPNSTNVIRPRATP